MGPVELTVLVLALAVVALAIAAVGRFTARRSQARRQLRDWLTTGAARQLGLAPGPHEIVHQYETTRRPGDPRDFYALTVLMRNRSGHYVMLKTGPAGLQARLLAPGAAKALLKQRYVPPAG